MKLVKPFTYPNPLADALMTNMIEFDPNFVLPSEEAYVNDEGEIHKRLKHDPVNHPSHYCSHPSGIECIEIAEHMNFNLGNALKYLWRNEGKNGIEDLRKAIWYINREIEKREKENGKN